MLAAYVKPAQAAQGDIAILSEASAEYTFGGQLLLQAHIAQVDAESRVIVQVFLRSQGEANTYSGEAVLEDDGVGGVRALYLHDLTGSPLRAFAMAEYWFAVTRLSSNGEMGAPEISQVYTFFYEDNLFAWQTLVDGPFRVHWYVGDIAFGQSVLDVARAGLQRAQNLLAYPTPGRVEIYVYASGADLQSSLKLGGVNLVAGHADPDLGVMVVSLPPGPGQRLETGRQVPHELVHILMYQKLGMRYQELPTWLSEGLASINEEYPNADYYTVLQEANQRSGRLPLANLCYAFPLDAATFYLSYAQSDSFTRFLFARYGASKMETLIQQYADGVSCTVAPQTVFGRSLAELEKEWANSLSGQNSVAGNPDLKELLPWAVLAAAALLWPVSRMVFGRKFSPAAARK